MKKIIKLLIPVAAVFVLSGCSFMSPVKAAPDTGYVINATPDYVKRAKRHSGILLVMAPDTNSAYNTSRMAFTTRPYQISYYANSRWIQTPGEMMAPLLSSTVQQTGRFKTVLTPPYSGLYDYALRTQIKTLLIDYTRCPAVVELTMQEDLINANTGRMIASREFSVLEELPQNSAYGAVYAANQAAAKIQSQIAAWLVRHT